MLILLLLFFFCFFCFFFLSLSSWFFFLSFFLVCWLLCDETEGCVRTRFSLAFFFFQHFFFFIFIFLGILLVGWFCVVFKVLVETKFSQSGFFCVVVVLFVCFSL